jgi:hypothetical protein
MTTEEAAEHRAEAIRQIMDRAPEPTDEQVALVSMLLLPAEAFPSAPAEAPERAA